MRIITPWGRVRPRALLEQTRETAISIYFLFISFMFFFFGVVIQLSSGENEKTSAYALSSAGDIICIILCIYIYLFECVWVYMARKKRGSEKKIQSCHDFFNIHRGSLLFTLPISHAFSCVLSALFSLSLLFFILCMHISINVSVCIFFFNRLFYSTCSSTLLRHSSFHLGACMAV